jgi:serine/threonine-protein kinase RsbW
LRFAATIDLLPQMIELINESLKEINLSAKQHFQLELSLEEALVNIIKYAYPVKSGEIDIVCNCLDNNGIEIEIKDWGIPFDPKKIAPKEIEELPLEERPIGGLGIYFICQLMDEVSYRRKEGANILRLVKRFKKS